MQDDIIEAMALAAATARHPDLFSDDPHVAHRAASPNSTAFARAVALEKAGVLIHAVLPIAMEHAAGIAEEHSFGIEIGEWLAMTKKDISAYACRSVATAIRAAGQP